MRGKIAYAQRPLGSRVGIAGTIMGVLKIPNTGAAFAFIDDRLEKGAIVKHAFGSLSRARKGLGIFIHEHILSHENFVAGTFKT